MKCDTPYYVLPKAGIEKVPVPCGKCPPCKKRRVDGWVFRMLQEGLRSENSHFVTLTYDTRHVPISDNGFMTLSKRDFQLFMKRLRKLSPCKLKYYAVGEYGTHNKRPHYHAIIFNCPDASMYHEAWGLGQIHVGNVTGDSIAYTMKYIDKSRYKPGHGRDDRQPEFPLMSKRLGDNYLTDEMVRYHKSDITRLYATHVGGSRIALPRYYKNKIYTEAEQKAQVKFIQQVGEKELAEYQRQFKLADYPPDYSFHTWMDTQKIARYQSFYHNQKKREL